MAGLGFELRKVYNKGSFLAKQKAYGYAGIIYVGPMILGSLVLLAGVFLSGVGRFDTSEILLNPSFLSHYQYFFYGCDPLCLRYAL